MDIQPKYLPLSELLHRRLFCIPDYQRPYSWTSHQRQDLFEDIEKVHEKGEEAHHFMSTVVCLRRKKLTLGIIDFDQMDVVDGQQRLTTLIILLNAVKLALDQAKKEEEEILARDLRELLVKVDGEKLLLLQTNHDTTGRFETYLRKGTSKKPPDTVNMVADWELLKAIEECENFVRRWPTEGRDLTALAKILMNRLFFLLHVTADEKSVYTVFEVLNSRGMEVSWLDRLKSILMGAAFELENEDSHGLIKNLRRNWRKIYTAIGLHKDMDTEALRFAATLWGEKRTDPPSRLLSKQDSVEAFRSEAKTAKQILDIADWLLDVTEAVKIITENSRLEAVTTISQARLLATALHLEKNIKTGERQNLLNRWEKVSFRIYGMSNKDARTGVGDYVKLAWRVVNDSLSPKDIEADIKKIGEKFPIDAAIDAMRNANCYEGWEKELRYFMFRYEEDLAKKKGVKFQNDEWEIIWMKSPAKSIEHIWAQNKAPENVRHTLGNLMILSPGINSALQDKSAKDKADAYRDTALHHARKVAKMIENDGWSRKSIKEREEELLNWAAVEWAD